MNTIKQNTNVQPKQNFIERFFKLSSFGTNIKTEITAGVVTFMTMAYVISVNPAIMQASGMDAGALTVSTIILSGIFCIIMGLFTNRPFATAPGMGVNAFFAFTLCVGAKIPWQTALGMVFISGLAFMLLTIGGIRERIVKIIPSGIKLALGAGIGLFITLLGFNNAGFLAYDKGTNLMTLGAFKSPSALLALIGFVIISVLLVKKVKGALLIGIIATTVIGIPMGITQLPNSFFSMPPSITPIAFKLDILGALKLAYLPLIFSFFMSDFIGNFGTLIGVSGRAGYLDKDGNLPEIHKPFMVDAIAASIGAVLGMCTVTTYVESASGIEEGGRTGLTAITTGILFLLTLLITPIILTIPAAATAPVLIIIGLLMIPGIKEINFNDHSESIPAFLCIVTMVFTFNPAVGIGAGLLAYVVINAISLKWEKLSWGQVILCLPLIYYFVII